MLNQPLIKFNFFEDSFEEELNKFKDIIKNLNNSNVHYSSLKNFPPCIIDKIISKADSNTLYLSRSNAILNNNLYFGENFKSLNRLFLRSPFISNKCKNCIHFKKNICRGLLNKKFLEKKEQIIKKIGLKRYNAVKSDYENGLFVFGSVCNNSCRFCVDKFAPEEVVKKIPFLSEYDIIHFLHYLSKKIQWVGTSYHCASGEFFDHPKFFKIMEFLPFFMSSKSWLFTNCISLDEDMLKIIKKKNLKLIFSIHTLNDDIRKRIMNYKEIFKIKDKLKLVDKYNIRYECWFVPLKFLIKSGDTDNSLNYLVNFTNTRKISFSTSSPSKYIPEEMKKELLVDNSLVNKLMRYNHKINYVDNGAKDIHNHKSEDNSFKKIADHIKKICNDKGLLVLAPKRSFDIFKKEFRNNINIEIRKVNSFLGENIDISGVLTVKDYVEVIQKSNPGYDYIIIPKNSFDINLDDFMLNSINEIYHYKNKPLILL